ncbi:efflux RND transporter permease subunit [Altererythrobacter sp. GH1-8]|uniref:efflux RND transporter permease subunit n=1 Tax=Altererythrobacter sp. GH1-8 TaxID=3349333 RepID=UPI00374D7203
MNLREISAWSIRNPVVPIVIFLGLTLAGIVSFNRLDIVNFPDIEFPAVSVNVSQPGAAPTEIEKQITQKIEASVASISGVEEISSTASEGNSSTFVSFAVGTDVDVATTEVKNAVDQIRSDLPEGILEPLVRKVDFTAGPGGNNLAFYAVRADDMTLEELSWFVDDVVARRLQAIPGMAQASRNGGVDREIRVTLDPARMQALGVTAREINNVLRQVNIDASGGEAEIAGSRQAVRVLGNADTAYELSEARISLPGGRTIKLADVADVTDGTSEQRSVSLYNGRQVVGFSFARARDRSDVAVYEAAVEEIGKIESEFPQVEFVELFTPVPYAKAQYTSSMAALIEGALLAIVVVFLFLRDWRATFISALAIPLSAIPTFWFMDLLGFNLNFLSLLALSLVAGVLVDDAIVEIENIVRHMRMGKSAYQASIDAADEIGLAVVSTTFCIVAVFLPVGLMPGVTGEFFKPFGLTVVVAVLASLAVARMITPMIAAYFLHAKGHAAHGEGRAMDFYMKILRWTMDDTRSKAMLADLPKAPSRWFYGPIATIVAIALIAVSLQAGIFIFQLAMEWDIWVLLAALVIPVIMVGAFLLIGFLLKLFLGVFGAFGRYFARFAERFMARTKDHRFYAFLMGIYALFITVALLAGLPQQFQPSTNEDTTVVNIDMVPGTTLEQTRLVSEEVAAMLLNEPEVKHVTQAVRIGSAQQYIALKPAAERDATSNEFQRRLTPALSEVADARVSFAFEGGGSSGRAISILLAGSDSEVLDETARQLVEEMKGVEGVVAPRISADLQQPELIIEPREDLAAQLGVTTAALSSAIRIATLGEIDQNAAKFSLSDRQVPIRVILPRESRSDLSTIENLPVPTASGDAVPLKRVANIRFGEGPTRIQRYNQSRRAVIGADLAPGAVRGPVMEAINALPTMQNLPIGVRQISVGEDRFQQELLANFAVAVISGILLVFGVLVLLYHRFVSPLVNMTSLLLAPLGGLLALMIIREPISMPVYIGILMLLGIVAKNSILLIDFAIDAMAEGKNKYDAIIDAGHKRAQPIVMTTVAMTAGMVPTAVSLSGDGAWRAPMGVTVIGGLILSTVLTLVIVPAGFSLADGFEKRVGPWLRTRFLTYKPGDEHYDEELSARTRPGAQGYRTGAEPAE